IRGHQGADGDRGGGAAGQGGGGARQRGHRRVAGIDGGREAAGGGIPVQQVVGVLGQHVGDDDVGGRAGAGVRDRDGVGGEVLEQETLSARRGRRVFGERNLTGAVDGLDGGVGWDVEPYHRHANA